MAASVAGAAIEGRALASAVGDGGKIGCMGRRCDAHLGASRSKRAPSARSRDSAPSEPPWRAALRKLEGASPFGRVQITIHLSLPTSEKEMNSTLTSKGQLTLPKAARDALQLIAGTRFAVEIAGGKLVLTPVRVNALAVRGVLKSPHRRPLSVEEMDEGISRTMKDKHGKRPRRAT